MTTPAASRLDPPTRRMLTKRQAADYLGITPVRFLQICTVAPVDLGGDLRFDVRQLDTWLDGLGKTSASMSRDDWLSRMDGDDD